MACNVPALLLYYCHVIPVSPLLFVEALQCTGNEIRRVSIDLDLLRSRLFRRVSSIFSPASQSVSAVRCQRGNYYFRIDPYKSRLFSCFPFFVFFVVCFCFMFLSLLLLRTPRRHKPSSDSHSIYVPQAQQNNLQSALHRTGKYIQQ